MRKFILSILGIAFIVFAIFLGKYIIDKNQAPKPTFKKNISEVFIETVLNKEIPIVLSANGNLMSKNKVEIFSEVQGVLQSSNKSFKPGTTYYKNETLLSINSDEFYTSLQSQKSNLFNLITAVLPDIRLDFPTQFKKWEDYLQSFDINKNVLKIPDFSSEKEKYFISGRGILTAYYTVKNLEVRLSKHQIKAPFTGVLTEALVTPGTLIRSGQKLGEFIDTSVYEIEVSIGAQYADMLRVGNTVSLSNMDKSKDYLGKVVRVNGKIDQISQTIKAYIELAHPDLKEGMFLQANLIAKSVPNAIEISRKLLVNNEAVYTIFNDSILTLTKVLPIYFGTETIVIVGLKNGDLLVSKPVLGAIDGMIVKINKTK